MSNKGGCGQSVFNIFLVLFFLKLSHMNTLPVRKTEYAVKLTRNFQVGCPGDGASEQIFES